jgi:hypothetical protein
MHRLLELLVLVALLVVPALGDAVYVFPSYTEPGHPATPPFQYTGGPGGFLLLKLDSSKRATEASAVNPSDPVSMYINTALTYAGHYGTINSGEGISLATMGSRVNAEIGSMDDQQFVQDGGPDAHLDIDYGNDASVFFRIPTLGATSLLIAEDAGLDPFKLQHCTSLAGSPGSTYGVGCTKLFDGWNPSVQNALVNGLFGTYDTGDIDQQFLFVFSDPKFGYFQLS